MPVIYLYEKLIYCHASEEQAVEERPSLRHLFFTFMAKNIVTSSLLRNSLNLRMLPPFSSLATERK